MTDYDEGGDLRIRCEIAPEGDLLADRLPRRIGSLGGECGG